MSSRKILILEDSDRALVGNLELPIEIIPPEFIVWNHGVYRRTADFDVYRRVFAWWAD